MAIARASAASCEPGVAFGSSTPSIMRICDLSQWPTPTMVFLTRLGAYSATGNAWRFLDADRHEHMVRVQGGVHANNGRMLAVLAAAGMGIVLEPDFIVAPELASGALVALLPGYAPAASGIYAVYPSRRHLSAKVRAFVDFLVERFRGGTSGDAAAEGRVADRPAPGASAQV